MLKEAFGDNVICLTQTYKWCKRFKNWRMTVDDDERSGRPSTGTTTENVAKVREAILEDRRRTIHDVCNIVKLSYGTGQRIFPDELNMRRIARQFLLQWKRLPSPTSLLTRPHPLWFFLISENEIEGQAKGDVVRALKRSGPNRKTWWICWCKMAFSSASDHRNPAGIAVLKKWTTSKEMEANTNFDKWLSLGRRI
jgi:hypothetical protein